MIPRRFVATSKMVVIRFYFREIPPVSLCELCIAIFISDDSASIRGNLENLGDMFFIFARSPESLCEFGIVI